MQPEPTEHSQSTTSQQSLFGGSSTSQHGPLAEQPSPSPSPFDQTGYGGGSSSEWSLSPPTSVSGWGSPSGHDAGLNSPSPSDLDAHRFALDAPSLDLTERDSRDETFHVADYATLQDRGSALHEFPEEMLFQIMSHLLPTDLLTVKLVSRRFYSLVTSPLAWMNAFNRFFPGPNALGASVEHSGRSDDALRSEQRLFTRLSSSASWSSEYLLRTRLLRCLIRGRPSLPFACPVPGKPGKGSATFTFSSRLVHGCSNLHADFGSVFDKRKPQFIHGLASTGAVTSSDRRGKFDSWGFVNRLAFRHFSETHPGHALWGLGQASVVGLPNMMDVSQPFGMIYGEATPSGTVYFLGSDEKHGSYLAPFLDAPVIERGIPRVSQDLQSTCSVWIAKATGVPRMTRGLIGMLSGSSAGVVSAYSLGPSLSREQRFAKGQLTARWAVSPGVPIIALAADDAFDPERSQRRRVWAIALNALGELFYLIDIPSGGQDALTGIDQEEVRDEVAAWETGRSAPWRLVQSSQRTSRYDDANTEPRVPTYLPKSCFRSAKEDKVDLSAEARSMSAWIGKTPLELRSQFHGWDMRRRLEVDFSNDDSAMSGEIACVISTGEDETQPAKLLRYMRSKPTPASSPEPSELPPSKAGQPGLNTDQSFTGTVGGDSSGLEDSILTLKPVQSTLDPSVDDGDGEWKTTNLAFGNYKNLVLTTSAIDQSHLARATPYEDAALRKAKSKHTSSEDSVPTQPSKSVPGQRARYIAVGTTAGTIFLWNLRAGASQFSTYVNDAPPIRVIHTDSPGISSLAINALYLVHGGQEGLVQAWDPLASTLEPLRTIGSRYAINYRRRVVIAAQQNVHGNNPPRWFTQGELAASAICLDPDPHVLRGAVTIGGYLRYWSFSSATLAEDLSRSQKRRTSRANAKGSQASGFIDSNNFKGRRLNSKAFIDQEVSQRNLEERERVRSARNERRMAGRFGLDLLGEEASEEDMLAYAKLLSEEENERQAKRLAAEEAKRRGDEGLDDLEAHRQTLSDADVEKWKFASWQQRYEMLRATAVPIPTTEDALRTPTKADDEVDEELKRALELSMQDESAASASLSSSPSAGSGHPEAAYDPDLAEAIALSLTQDDQVSSSPPAPAGTSRGRLTPTFNEQDDIARAIKLSLQASPRTEVSSSSRSASFSVDDEFPALSSSPSPAPSPAGGSAWGAASRGKGKGRE